MKKINKKSIEKFFLMAVFIFGSMFMVVSVQASDISKSGIIDLVNKSRAAIGLSTLSESDVLNSAAKYKAEDMIENDYFAHTSPS